MAINLHRLRRALPPSSSIVHHFIHLPKPISTPSSIYNVLSATSCSTAVSAFSSSQSTRSFSSTNPLRLADRRKVFDPETDEIGPDTILFEGCDYNHWLITVDFPKDSDLTREQKIDFYINIAAQVFGSVEEAKKKIYALSTTTYEGFQVECSEETSNKFQSIPGVVFVLPDSYIDPVNKEYGGDKYVNGEIFPRPPPVHYGRRNNRDRRPREQMPYQQGNAYNSQGTSNFETRNHGQNYGPPPQQNYGPPPPRNFVPPPPQPNFGPPPPQRNFGSPPPPQQNFGSPPPPQQNFAPHPPQRNYGPPPPQQNYGPPPPQRNYGPPPPQQNYGPPPPQQNYGLPPQQSYGQPLPQQSYGQPLPQQNYGQPLPQQNYVPPPPQNYNVPPTQQDYPLPPASSRQNYDQARNFPPRDNYGVGGVGRNPISSYQGNFSQEERGNYNAQGQRDFQQGKLQNLVPPERPSFSGDMNYKSVQGGLFEQGSAGNEDQTERIPFEQNQSKQVEDQTSPQMDQKNLSSPGNS